MWRHVCAHIQGGVCWCAVLDDTAPGCGPLLMNRVMGPSFLWLRPSFLWRSRGALAVAGCVLGVEGDGHCAVVRCVSEGGGQGRRREALEGAKWGGARDEVVHGSHRHGALANGQQTTMEIASVVVVAVVMVWGYSLSSLR